MPDADVILEFVGEGRTDVGSPDGAPLPPTSGVVVILVHRMCGSPQRMVAKRRTLQFLQGKGLWQKVRFAKQQAFYNRSGGCVFVIDSEGDLSQKIKSLHKGRDAGMPDFPMAVGVAHACIEAWLLADAAALQRATGLAVSPNVPEHPEDLPAPNQDKNRNPKTALEDLCGVRSADEKHRIAAAMLDLDLVKQRCPRGFLPFAEEVTTRIKPLFD